MRRSERRRHTDWRGETRRVEELIPVLEAGVREPGFAHDIDSQMWAIGFLSRFYPHHQELLGSLAHEFCDKTGMLDPTNGDPSLRFLHLLEMPLEDDPTEVIANIRASLKATRREPGPPLPGEEIFPREGWLGQYLAYTQETRAPLVYHFWMGVALLGAACRRNIYMEVGYRLYPNQYLFFVGETAEGKGIAFEKGTPVIWRANEVVLDEAENFTPGIGPLKDGHYPKRTIAILPNKPTPQSMVNALVPQDQGTERGILLKGLDSVGWLANEEVSSWLGRHENVYGGCVHIITAFYNCEKNWVASTIARGAEKLRNMCLSVLCGSNMEWINKSVTPDMFAGGFIRRCFFINRADAEKRTFLDEPPPSSDPLQANLLAEQMATLMMLKEPLEVEIAPEAKHLYAKFARDCENLRKDPTDPKLTYYYLGKYNFVLKLAMVLAVNNVIHPNITVDEIFSFFGHLTIRPEELDKAIQLIEFEEPYLKECFHRIGEHHQASQHRAIMKEIAAYHAERHRPMRMTDLGAKMLPRLGGAWKHRVEDLVEAGRLKRALVREGMGRPPLCIWDPLILDWEEEAP